MFMELEKTQEKEASVEDRVKLLLGANYPFKDFYFFLRKEMGKPHSTAMQYTSCIRRMFKSKRSIKKCLEKRDAVGLAQAVRRYVVEKNRKYPVSALYAYLQYLWEKERDEWFLNAPKIIAMEVKKVKIREKKDRTYLKKEQVRQLIGYLTQLKSRYTEEVIVFVMMQFETGCRGGALHKALISQLTFDEQEVRYWLTLREKGGRIIRHPLSRSLTIKLKEYLKRLEIKYPNRKRLFKISYQHLWLLLKKVAKSKMGIDLYPHMLRRGLASEIYNKTHDVKLVQKKLGHAMASTTLKCYIDSFQSPEDLHLDDMEW